MKKDKLKTNYLTKQFKGLAQRDQSRFYKAIPTNSRFECKATMLPVSSRRFRRATVKAINAKVAKLATDPRAVRDSVQDDDCDLFSSSFVEIFSQGSADEQAIGMSPQ